MHWTCTINTITTILGCFKSPFSCWWFGTLLFSIYWECHHPNWRTHIFQRGWNHQPEIVHTVHTSDVWICPETMAILLGKMDDKRYLVWLSYFQMKPDGLGGTSMWMIQFKLTLPFCWACSPLLSLIVDPSACHTVWVVRALKALALEDSPGSRQVF